MQDTTHGYEYPEGADAAGDLPAAVQALAETIEAQLMEIRSGNFSKALTAGAWTDHTIDFTGSGLLAPWKTTPNFIIVPFSPVSAADLDCYVKSRSTTQVVFTVKSGATASRGFFWMGQG